MPRITEESNQQSAEQSAHIAIEGHSPVGHIDLIGRSQGTAAQGPDAVREPAALLGVPSCALSASRMDSRWPNWDVVCIAIPAISPKSSEPNGPFPRRSPSAVTGCCTHTGRSFGCTRWSSPVPATPDNEATSPPRMRPVTTIMWPREPVAWLAGRPPRRCRRPTTSSSRPVPPTGGLSSCPSHAGLSSKFSALQQSV